MGFSKWVFRAAGIWGLLVVPPLYFLEDTIGRTNPPAITHPEIYYGLIGVTLAWQLAFLVISSDPVRFRMLMLPAVVEKFSFVVATIALHLTGRLPASQLMMPATDLVLGTLFTIAYFKTSPQKTPMPH